jgi:RNA polymerase sigma factor (sigma-70 family)
MGQDRRIMRQLDTLFTVGTVRELTDGQLLERFANREGDAAEQAFIALVERHGPMVLRVCRGVLDDHEDTQDAFQATFLVLVRKARSLWVCDSIGPWLHQVALRTASAARRESALRRRHERAAAAAKRESRLDPARELGQLLHQEIERLPERFRVPVVLCDLEGRTHEETARHLGWPVGTVKSRLSRGRERLRDRLVRRGVAPAAVIAALSRTDALGEPISAALLESTSASAARFVGSEQIVRASVASLAQGVLKAMFVSRWLKVVSILLVAGATATGVDLLARRAASGVEPGAGQAAQGGPGSEIPLAEANEGTFRSALIQNGTLESGKQEDLKSWVEGQTTIISIVPEGSKVRKGQVVAELDSATLRDQLVNQKIATQSAEAAYQNARLTREVAEIAVKEYVDGVYLQDRATVQGEIGLTKSAREMARAKVDRARRARQKLGDVISQKVPGITTADVLAELDIDDRIEKSEHDLLRETFALEKMQKKLDVLDNYTKPKTLKELQTEVQKARALELAKKQTFQLERDNEFKLEKQIINCKLIAPCDGVVVYANSWLAGGRNGRIEEGGTVSEAQHILSIFDLDGPVLIPIKVPEALVKTIKPGDKARVDVHAFPGESSTGEVAEVYPLPNPPSNEPGKYYKAKIRLDKGPTGVRPGMSATIVIPGTLREKALKVPVAAVCHFANKDHVAVKQADGRFEWRAVTLGDVNETGTLREIKEGLKPGEKVAMVWEMSEEDRNRHFVPPLTPSRAGAAQSQ